MTTHINMLTLWDNGVEMWVADDQPVHVAFISGEPPRVFINGKDITPDFSRVKLVEGTTHADHALTSEEILKHWNKANEVEEESS